MGVSIPPLNPLTPRRAGRRSPWGGGTTPAPGDDQAKSPTTFAGMQQRGVARPAPPAGSSYYGPAAGSGAPPVAPPVAAPAATYTPPVSGVRPQLTTAVSQLLAQPSGYQADQVQRDYGLLDQNLALDAKSGKRAIDEEMARRGLHASTFTGDRYGDLQAKQDLARSTFSTNFLDSEAKDMAAARASAIASALGFEQMSGDEGLATFGANQAAQNQSFTQGMDSARLASDNRNAAADRGLQRDLQGNQIAASTRSSDLDRALQQTLGLGGQDIQKQQIASAEKMSAADREQRGQLAAQQLGLDYSKLSEEDKQYLGNLDLGKQQLSTTKELAIGDREQRAKEAAAQLGLDYSKLSQQDKQFLIEQTGLVGDQKTLGAQSLDVQRDALKAQLAQQENDFNLRILQLLSALGFPKGTTPADLGKYGIRNGGGGRTDGSEGGSGGGGNTDGGT